MRTCVHTHRGKTYRLNRRYQGLIITNTWLLKQCIVHMCQQQQSMRISSDFISISPHHFQRHGFHWTWAHELAKLAGQKDLRDNVRSGKCCCGYCIWLFTLVLGIQTLAPLYYAASTLPTGPSSRSSRPLMTAWLVTLTDFQNSYLALTLQSRWVQPLTSVLVRVTTVRMKRHKRSVLHTCVNTA